MRKIILSAMVLLFTTSVLANKAKVEQLGDYSKYSIHVNADRLADYLSLDNSQMQDVVRINEYLAWELERSKYQTAEKREAAIRKAVLVNVKSMRETLSEVQYKRYLRVLNITLQNKGLWNYVMASK